MSVLIDRLNVIERHVRLYPLASLIQGCPGRPTFDPRKLAYCSVPLLGDEAGIRTERGIRANNYAKDRTCKGAAPHRLGYPSFRRLVVSIMRNSDVVT